MQLAGFQKTTLVDFPGIVATTVFTRGCSFRCGFCHNPELVLSEEFLGLISESEFFDFLMSRVGKIEGVCITGGEPLLQNDIDKFISHIRALGFKVKLDTNGSFPDRLLKIIKDGDVDYIAMDIKSPLHNYEAVTNSKFQIPNSKQIPNLKLEKLKTDIKKSIKLIMDSGIDYEFRTTVCHPYHQVDDFKSIGKLIKGAKRYYLQNFVESKWIDKNIYFTPFTDSELKEAVKLVLPYVKLCSIR